jgi:hypothetical protein
MFPCTARAGNSPRVTRSTNNAVDVALRLDAPGEGRLEKVRTRPDDPFTFRVRLVSPEQVDDELLGILARALDQNT